jgi:hypothetical protein
MKGEGWDLQAKAEPRRMLTKGDLFRKFRPDAAAEGQAAGEGMAAAVERGARMVSKVKKYMFISWEWSSLG